MAARSAYSLGLHREETMVIFPPAEQHLRRKVWRSLFVMDRFLAISLGRPPAIREEDCSGDALDPPPASPHPTPSDMKFYYSGLEAGVRGCHILSIIIRDVYSKRKVSTKTAQAIADRCKVWPKTLPAALHWRQASPSNPRQAILILHVNMIYCHAIILFTRPFFLYLLSSELQRKYLGSHEYPKPRRGKTEKFSEACIIASLHSIAIIQTACEGGYLPMQNPFIIYCLFSAALVILTGRLAIHSTHEASDQSIENAVSILSYCGTLDPQAARMVQIIASFRDIIFKQDRQGQSPQQSMSSSITLPSSTPGSFPQHRFSPFVQQMTHPDPSSQLAGSVSSTHHGPPTSPLDPTISAPPPMPSFSLPTLASPTSSAPAQTAPPRMPYIRTDSFSGLLDLDNTDNLLGASGSEESSGPENDIDFASLWAWPGSDVGTPAAGVNGGADGAGGSRAGSGMAGMRLKDLGVQGISDSPVPLFGTSMSALADEA